MDASVTGTQPSLRDHLRVIRARKGIILLGLVFVTAAVLAYSYTRTPVYEAESRVLIKPIPSTPFINAGTESQVVGSTSVARLVQTRLSVPSSAGALLAHLSVEPLQGPTSNQSEVLVISYTSPDPVFAQRAANAFAEEYVLRRQSQAVTLATGAQSSLQRRMRTIRGRLRTIIGQIEAAREAGETTKVETLETERSVLSSQLGVLQQQLGDATSQAVNIDAGEVLEAAPVPRKPAFPNHTSHGAMGVALGLLLGVGLAFLREHFDDRFRGRRDVEEAIAAPVLATITRFPKLKKTAVSRLVVTADPAGVASEAFRNLRTNLEFICSRQDASSVLITSPMAGEGKTLITANLAATYARAGRSVAALSADLRRPTLETYFECHSEAGLRQWLLGEPVTLGSIVTRTRYPGVSLVPSGGVPRNPAELLTSLRLPELIRYLEQEFDVVLIDSPPTLPVADAVIIAPHAGVTVLVLNASSTKRSPAVHAREQLERVGAPPVGAILNGIDLSGPSYHYQPYYYSGYDAKQRYEASAPVEHIEGRGANKGRRSRRTRKRSSNLG